MNANIFAAFAAAAARASDRTFLDEGGRILDYAGMLQRTAEVSGALKSLGIRQGDRVVAQVDKSVSAVLLYLGCLRAGAVFIPLNTAYIPSEVAYFLGDAQPKLFVCTDEAAQSMRAADAIPADMQVVTLNADETGSFARIDAPADVAIARCVGEDVAAILYTSGTTGRSKGAMLTHENLLSNVRALNTIWQWRDDDVLIHALPIFHAHGLFVALHCSLLRATPMLFHKSFDAEAVIADLSRASVFMGVPTFYARLLKQDGLTSDATAGVRVFISGSAPLTEMVFNAFEARTGKRILERYGMTEALMITSNPYDGNRVAATVGFPLPDVRVRVREPGEPGVLEIRGPNVFRGYWRQPIKTREAFTDDGYFVTGDVATIDADGRVSLVGRETDLVISGGYNVYPKEIEMLIDEMAGVEEAAVIGVPHPDFGEAVVAIVVAQSGAVIDVDAIGETLRLRLAAFKRPKKILPIESLPRNAMGKVEKKLLRQQHAELFA